MTEPSSPSSTSKIIKTSIDTNGAFKKFESLSIKSSSSSSSKDAGPTRSLTSNIEETYRRCNPSQFKYRKCLTKDSKATNNRDNKDGHLIIHKGDVFRVPDRSYRVESLLGTGVFAQVVMCKCSKTGDSVAVKVIKNRSEYFNQAVMEVRVMQQLNLNYQRNENIVSMLSSFMYENHLCLTFERLYENLFEVLKLRKFKGISLETIASVADQLLKALSILDASTIIHADLKPENILLMKPYRGDEEKGLQIKLADFGSAVVGFEKHSAPYIQSRYYRAPEAIVGVPFTSAIDMWSLGCILCELFIARPIFPGQSECEQIYIITRALRSDIPKEILRKGLKTNNFFEFIKGRFCVKRSRKWKSMSSPVEHFDARLEREFEGRTKSDEDKKSKNRFKGFVHFVRNLLDIDPDLRWNPFEARQHPFLSGQIFRDSFIPSSETSSSKAQHSMKIQVPKVRSISLENQHSITPSIVT